jgi:hypothetical protein
MTGPGHESARVGCVSSRLRAQDPTASKAGPMPSLPYRPAYMRQHHQTRLRKELTHPLGADPAEVWAEISAIWDEIGALGHGQDALDVGVIEADLNGSRANARADAVFDKMRELTDEIRAERSGTDSLPSYEVIRDELEAATPIPPGSNESLSREINSTDEEMLAALATELWKNDEYLEIVAEDYRQRNGGAS